MPSDATETENEYQAEDGPADLCVFCDHETPGNDAEAEIYLMGDYVSTPLGEDTDGYRVGLCGHHHSLLRERVNRTDADKMVVR